MVTMKVTGVSRAAISRYENYQADISGDSLIAIAAFFKVTTDYLLISIKEFALKCNANEEEIKKLIFDEISIITIFQIEKIMGLERYSLIRPLIKNFSKMQLKKIYALLEEVDFSIKSGAMLQENIQSFTADFLVFLCKLADYDRRQSCFIKAAAINKSCFIFYA